MASDTQELLTADANTLGGIIFEVSAPGSNVKQLVTRIEFWGKRNADIDVDIYDLDTGQLLETVTLTDCKAGEVSGFNFDLSFQYLRQRRRLFFTTTEDEYYRTDMFGGGCASCNSKEYRQGMVTAYGGRIDDSVAMKWSNIQRVSHTSGLALITTVACDHAAMLCEIKESLALPFLYKQAEEITRLGLFNASRFNDERMDLEELAKKASWYLQQYSTSIETLMSNMPPPGDRLCYECRSSARTVVMIP
jgi:hypothetical protein